jgi:endonuclease/exonuclease/phosphatase family metal-dependent hydrolase
VTGPDFHAARAPLHTVSVLNWNIYVGTNVDAVLVALASPDPADDVPAMLAAIERFQATDFATRAEAIADRIAHKRPHVVGLQEVSEISVDLTALGVPIVIDLDFLAVLQAALAARGLRYEVAAAVTNTVATPLPGIRLVDHDVLLADPARADVVSTIARNFAVSLGVVAPGVEIKRGWVAATASVDGRTYTFVNTHLEAGAGEPFSRIRAAQALELMAALDGAAPVVLMGDLNDEVGSPMYAVVAGAGFVDLWAALRPGAPGLTCCHDSDLSNPVATFDQRIDYVLTRGFDAGKPHPRGQITIVGEVPADRLAGPAYPIWPSDHAGLAATLLAPPQGVIMAAAATARREP